MKQEANKEEGLGGSFIPNYRKIYREELLGESQESRDSSVN